MVLSSVQKVWKNNKSLCICIPANVCNALEIERGDLIQVSWDEVITLKDSRNNKLNDGDLPEL